MKKTDPPRLAIWLLTRRLSAEWRDFVVGDLEEEFATRRGDSPVAAHVWLWWQTMRCLAAPPPVRPNPLPLGSSQGDSRMRTVFADLRYAFRVMSRTPSFAVAVVSVLALGIGANTTIFSIVNAVLLRPLPFEEPERLVRIFTRTGPGGRLFELSPGKFYELAAGCAVVRGHGDVSMLRLQGARAHGHGYRANSTCDSRERGLFRGRQSPTGARTRLSARGGHARRQVRRRPERPVLENRIRRRHRT